MVHILRRFFHRQPTFAQFVRFGIVGVANTFVHLAVYSTLVVLVHVPYLWANVVAFAVATVNSYYFNRSWTFRSAEQLWHKEAGKFLAVSGLGFLMNELLLWTFVRHGGWSKIWGEGAAILIVLGWNYAANKWWTFRGKVG